MGLNSFSIIASADFIIVPYLLVGIETFLPKDEEGKLTLDVQGKFYMIFVIITLFLSTVFFYIGGREMVKNKQGEEKEDKEERKNFQS